MKCNKCGFTSFDYLSECKNCGLDLTAVRDALGLLSMKPSVPLFLGELLRSYDLPPTKVAAEKAEAEAQESSFAGISFGEDFDLEDGLIIGEEDKQPAAHMGRDSTVVGREPSKGPSQAMDENMLIELSDEDLTQFIRDTEADGSMELEFDFQLETESGLGLASAALDADEPTQVMRPKVTSGPGAEPTEETPTIDLSDEDLDKFLLDQDLEKGFDLKVEETVDAAHDARVGVEAAGWKRPGSGDAAEENLVLELSEDDLENFLLELEETQVDAGKTTGNGGQANGTSKPN
jgi:hypothetical protein